MRVFEIESRPAMSARGGTAKKCSEKSAWLQMGAPVAALATLLSQLSIGPKNDRAALMGQKWGKPYAILCHPMPIMHLCKLSWTCITARKRGPIPQNPRHTPTQSGCALLETIRS